MESNKLEVDSFRKYNWKTRWCTYIYKNCLRNLYLHTWNKNWVQRSNSSASITFQGSYRIRLKGRVYLAILSKPNNIIWSSWQVLILCKRNLVYFSYSNLESYFKFKCYHDMVYLSLVQVQVNPVFRPSLWRGS